MSKSKNQHTTSSPKTGRDSDEPNGWNRREFIAGVGKGAVGVAVGASLFSAFSPFIAEAAEGALFALNPVVSSDGGVIACISKEASLAGVDVLDRGGNAMDAAVATAFALGVTRPDFCGIGGDGFLVYRGRDGQMGALDFRLAAPAAVTPTTFMTPYVDTPFGKFNGRDRDIDNCAVPVGTGHGVVGVPGMVAGMAAALERFGSRRFRFADLIERAEELARYGCVVAWGLGGFGFCEQDRFARFPETYRIYGDLYERYRAGLKLYQPDYADSLKLIMEFGPEAFYQVKDYPGKTVTALPRASIAKLIIRDMQTSGLAYGALMTEDDLSSYQARWWTPLVGSYRGHQIIGMPPPSSGGIAIIEILNLLDDERFPLGSNSLDPAANPKTSWAQSSANHFHVLAEAQKIAWADRNRYVADPDKVQVPTEMLTSKEYAQQRRADIDLNQAKVLKNIQPAQNHTTHLSVIDRDGNAVAMTLSLGSAFGSVVVAPGTGFALTDQLNDFNVDYPDTANAPGPGKRPRSSQSPTIVVREDGRPALVVGGAGGPTIIMGVVQTIVNVLDFGQSIAHALDAERIDAAARVDPESDVPSLHMEAARVAVEVQAELESREHNIVPLGALAINKTSDTTRRNDTYVEYAGLPNIQAAGFNPQTGKYEAVNDPRADVGSAGQGDFSDLRVTNITTNPNQAREGEKVTITATITNTGSVPAGTSRTEFLLDGAAVIGLVDTPAIPARAAAAVSVYWDTRGVRGEHTIRVTADKTGLVAEGNEDNNAATLAVTVKGNKVTNPF